MNAETILAKKISSNHFDQIEYNLMYELATYCSYSEIYAICVHRTQNDAINNSIILKVQSNCRKSKERQTKSMLQAYTHIV